MWRCANNVIDIKVRPRKVRGEVVHSATQAEKGVGVSQDEFRLIGAVNH